MTGSYSGQMTRRALYWNFTQGCSTALQIHLSDCAILQPINTVSLQPLETCLLSLQGALLPLLPSWPSLAATMRLFYLLLLPLCLLFAQVAPGELGDPLEHSRPGAGNSGAR